MGLVVIDVMGYFLVVIRDVCVGGSFEEFKNDLSGGNVDMFLFFGLIEFFFDLFRKFEFLIIIKKVLK